MKRNVKRKKENERWKENYLVKHVSALYFRIHALTCLGRAIVSTKPKGIRKRERKREKRCKRDGEKERELRRMKKKERV